MNAEFINKGLISIPCWYNKTKGLNFRVNHKLGAVLPIGESGIGLSEHVFENVGSCVEGRV